MSLAIPKPSPRIKEPKRLKSRPHQIPSLVRFVTFDRWGRTCLWCQQPGGALDLHHVLRRSQGGKDESANLRPVHRLCHQAIHDGPAEAKRRGFLA